jgi:hypothetical protein
MRRITDLLLVVSRVDELARAASIGNRPHDAANLRDVSRELQRIAALLPPDDAPERKGAPIQPYELAET